MLAMTVEFEGEPVAVDRLVEARRHAARGEPRHEAVLGLPDEFARLVLRRAGGEGRQDRACACAVGRRSARDLDRVGRRLRQVGEEGQHFRTRLEAVLGRQLAAFALADHGALRDADQRVMRLVVGQSREIGLVGRDERQAAIVGDVDQRVPSASRSLREAMPLQARCRADRRNRSSSVASRSIAASGRP